MKPEPVMNDGGPYSFRDVAGQDCGLLEPSIAGIRSREIQW